MLTVKHILSCVRCQDWFAAIDLKDAYFHVSILPRHRPFHQFAFEGWAYQYKVLPLGLALSPCVFTKLTEGALTPLWEKGIRILNYLDDWLIAHARDRLCEHRDLVLRHLSHLGLRVNWEKSKLSPVQSISFLGMELDSVNMTARLTDEHVQSVLNMGMAPWHVPGRRYLGVLLPQSLVGPCVPMGRSAPGLGVKACGCEHRWLQDGLGCRIQRAGSLGTSIASKCSQCFLPYAGSYRCYATSTS
ncbi:hypothetical protein H4Q32_011552 [Labeo rohita]|uniref:ribonuclease H n=1 Tax=Labeo rohita TaxID=84645 RepID=A0ABQ8LWI8_LABRO|nr:hypothetical protein H4Q32_011552 [Labeo rohita]